MSKSWTKFGPATGKSTLWITTCNELIIKINYGGVPSVITRGTDYIYVCTLSLQPGSETVQYIVRGTAGSGGRWFNIAINSSYMILQNAYSDGVDITDSTVIEYYYR